jgi:DNA invertase Pin-like site-specific DNA recombinase
MKAVGYCRVSGDGQITGGGFPRQESAIEGWCASQSVELLRFYREEGIAGKLGEESRPAFQEMVAELLSNGCRTVVVESLDRLARQYDIQQQLATYLASKGISLISANTGEDITAALNGDPMRRAMIQIQGIFAELDKNLLVAKLKKGLERKKELTGKAQGRIVYGLKPGEAETLAEMKLMRGSMTFQQIADALNSRESLARSGKPWKVGSVAKILSREN